MNEPHMRPPLANSRSLLLHRIWIAGTNHGRPEPHRSPVFDSVCLPASSRSGAFDFGHFDDYGLWDFPHLPPTTRCKGEELLDLFFFHTRAFLGADLPLTMDA
jgi:hypothetical protein